MFTPPNHRDFKAVLLAKDIDENIMDCAIAYIEKNGGGPFPAHTHSHDHLFTVIEGDIQIKIEEKNINLSEGMSIRVVGERLHSVCNIGKKTAKVMGISIRKTKI